MRLLSLTHFCTDLQRRPRGCGHVIMATGSSGVPERGHFHLDCFGSIKLTVDGKTAWLKDNLHSVAFSNKPIPVGRKFSVKVLEESLALYAVSFKYYKMFPPKARADVEMMQCVSVGHGKPTGGKTVETRKRAGPCKEEA